MSTDQYLVDEIERQRRLVASLRADCAKLRAERHAICDALGITTDDEAENPAGVAMRLVADRDRLAAEVDEVTSKHDHSLYWWSTRWEVLADEIRQHATLTEDEQKRFFSIIANGTAAASDPPTYAQLFNIERWAKERAEQERDAAIAACNLAVAERDEARAEADTEGRRAAQAARTRDRERQIADAATDRVKRTERERDAAIAACDEAANDTAEAIARWLEVQYGGGIHGQIAQAIRAGRWRLSEKEEDALLRHVSDPNGGSNG